MEHPGENPGRSSTSSYLRTENGVTSSDITMVDRSPSASRAVTGDVPLVLGSTKMVSNSRWEKCHDADSTFTCVPRTLHLADVMYLSVESRTLQQTLF